MVSSPLGMAGDRRDRKVRAGERRDGWIKIGGGQEYLQGKEEVKK